jgi:hypothetical protein
LCYYPIFCYFFRREDPSKNKNVDPLVPYQVILKPNGPLIKAFGLKIILENGLDVDATLSNVIRPNGTH